MIEHEQAIIEALTYMTVAAPSSSSFLMQRLASLEVLNIPQHVKILTSTTRSRSWHCPGLEAALSRSQDAPA
jgi:hypothetical protein